jgi:hypothetical protein
MCILVMVQVSLDAVDQLQLSAAQTLACLGYVRAMARAAADKQGQAGHDVMMANGGPTPPTAPS